MYNERNGNLFDEVIIDKNNPKIIFMQCGSNDLALGAGIARSFNAYYNTRNLLKELKKQIEDDNPNDNGIGNVYYTSPVLTLITKERFYHKPTLDTLSSCLEIIPDTIKNMIDSYETECKLEEIRCPMLGCGLDKLKWSDVRPLLIKLAKELEELGINLTVIDYRLGDDVNGKN